MPIIGSSTKRLFHYFDWISFFLAFSLNVIGIIFIASATYNPINPYSLFFKKQCIGMISALAWYMLFVCIDYRALCDYVTLLYWVVNGLLIVTLIKGSVGMGAQRWINVIIFKFQPSELLKLTIPAYVAYYSRRQQDIPTHHNGDFIPIVITIALSCLLVLKQPDLGTALLIGISSCIALWYAGLSTKSFALLLLATGISAPLLWYGLKPYQQKRILVFLGYGNNTKERYQREQAIIALGSGTVIGKGLFNGTQNKLMFLPEGRTDFIFAVLAEEVGFVGAMIVLIMYALLFFHILYLISTIGNFYARLLMIGLITPTILATCINLMMVMGLLPIVGIPLPLMSYGITHLWVTWASLGWIQGIYMRQWCLE